MTDHRTRPRRRGAALTEAVYQAVLAELAEVGYAGLTMERVAERARTGKASLYRRWSSRMELVVDAVYHAVPDPSDLPDTGSLREDLLALMRRSTALLAGPAGQALRALLGDALADRERMAEFRGLSQHSGRRAVALLAARAVARGEIDAAAVTSRRLEVGQAMVRQHFLFGDVPVPDALLVEIVDDVLVPLLHSPPGSPGVSAPAEPLERTPDDGRVLRGPERG